MTTEAGDSARGSTSSSRSSSAGDGCVIWLVGLPASGKSVAARGVIAALRTRGTPTLWLDSDDLRAVLTPQPTYSDAERDWFYGALGHIARRAAAGGVIVVVSATAPRRRYRDAVREAVPRFVEVYLVCARHELERRDGKGLYARAARGELPTFPGVSSPFEVPLDPELTLDSGVLSPIEIVAAILQRLDA